MGTLLKEDFVERRCHPTKTNLPNWRLETGGQYFELDLKMCQLKKLDYDFQWGKEVGMLPRMASVIETPSRIVRLDLSLNELQALDHAGIKHFKNLRELNASLNRISNFIGIELLKFLYSLNLSHNFIRRIDNLVASESLVELNLSMNELQDMSFMPSMINLQVLNISNNKIRSLDGVQSLPRLRELYAQRNDIADAVPLTSCFYIQVLNLSDNHITTLHNTVDILAQLSRLEVLSLYGNPIDRDPMYRNELLRMTHIMTLDNISVRPLPKPSGAEELERYEPAFKHKQNIHSLKDAARQAFEERMRESRNKMAEQIGFLQRRIVELQKENEEYEMRLNNDLDSCIRYLDTLSLTEVGSVSHHTIRESMGTPDAKPWQRHKDRNRNDRNRSDYSHIKETEQVLKLASKELRDETAQYQ